MEENGFDFLVLNRRYIADLVRSDPEWATTRILVAGETLRLAEILAECVRNAVAWYPQTVTDDGLSFMVKTLNEWKDRVK